MGIDNIGPVMGGEGMEDKRTLLKNDDRSSQQLLVAGELILILKRRRRKKGRRFNPKIITADPFFVYLTNWASFFTLGIPIKRPKNAMRLFPDEFSQIGTIPNVESCCAPLLSVFLSVAFFPRFTLTYRKLFRRPMQALLKS